MHSELEAAMSAIEARQVDPALSARMTRAALAGLGSKYLALGAPSSLGLVACGPDAQALRVSHAIVFGSLSCRSAGSNQLTAEGAVVATTFEEAFACDIVCLTTSIDFEFEWIPDATHLNIVDSGPWSSGMESLADCARITSVGTPRHSLRTQHGGLEDVITGKVSGRVGEEVTVLLWTPVSSLAP